MGWLIAGLLGLVLLAGLAVVIRRVGGSRRAADDTLVTDLLGPPEVPAGPAPPVGEEAELPPAPRAGEGDGPAPVPRAGEGDGPPPVPRAGEGDGPPPVPRARKEGGHGPPDGAGDWLETQLAWITAWSQRMHQEIESAGRPDPDRNE
jgi:hypothetical protein